MKNFELTRGAAVRCSVTMILAVANGILAVANGILAVANGMLAVAIGILAVAIGVSLSPPAWADDGATRGVVKPPVDRPYLVVLGNAQDAGYPQAGCHKGCCQPAWGNPDLRRHASSIGIVDPQSGQRWFIDCTPDFPDQLRMLDRLAPPRQLPGIDGILLTHAHIGHYAGLVHLGREVMGARGVPVYAMPRMREFLTRNGPWSQLVAIENIVLKDPGECVNRAAERAHSPDAVSCSPSW